MRMLVPGFGGLMRAQGVLIGLIVLLVALFLAQSLGPAGWERPFMATPAAVIESWHRLADGAAGAGDWRQFSTLLSCAFLHGDVFHLAGNILYLWGFGALVSELLGWRWMLGVFLLTALGASVTHVAMHPADWTPMLGASGAVMGFMGAYLGLAVRWELPDPHVWPMARPVPPSHLAILAVVFVALDYQAIFGGSLEMIAFGAHAGGFTTGLLLTAVVTPMPRSARPRRR